jgi:hypothetical protein
VTQPIALRQDRIKNKLSWTTNHAYKLAETDVNVQPVQAITDIPAPWFLKALTACGTYIAAMTKPENP